MIRRYTRGILIIICVLIFSSCVTAIPDIRENPQRYSGKTFTIKGEVMNVINIPFIDSSVFLFGNKDIQAPVVSSIRHEKGETYYMKGRVIAFPEEDTKVASREAVRSIADFLITHDIADEDKAEKVGASVLSGLYKVSEGLGQIFFILEEDVLLR